MKKRILNLSMTQERSFQPYQEANMNCWISIKLAMNVLGLFNQYIETSTSSIFLKPHNEKVDFKIIAESVFVQEKHNKLPCFNASFQQN